MKDKKYLFMAVGGYLGLVSTLTILLSVFRDAQLFFFNLATGIIISWIVVLIVYIIWAIYFFNINLGWVDEDWERLTMKKDKNPEYENENEPKENPHAGETLGLPPGTVRGIIAISLLVCGLAMVVASFQLNQTYDANALFVDNFEFFKTAFLMMIAFYFGNKSLEAISNRNQGVYRPQQTVGGTNTHSENGSNRNNFGSSSQANNTVQPAPPVPTLNTSQAGQLKKALQTENTETTESSDSADFQDKEALG